MSWLRWETGRTSPNNYFKMLLLKLPFADCYLLKFPTGSSIDWHRDPCGHLNHHRINVFLKRAKSGGHVMSQRIVKVSDDEAMRLTLRHKARVDYMRPDITVHAVSEVKEGSALILSIGWVWPNRS